MFLSKKSVLKSLLVIGLLGMPQQTKTFDIGITGFYVIVIAPPLAIIGLAGATYSFLTGHDKASNIVKYQEDIRTYKIRIAAWPKGKPEKKQIVSFTATTPEEIIEKAFEYTKAKRAEGNSVRMRPFITLETGKNIQLHTITVKRSSLESVKNKLITRFIVPEKRHLTYKTKIVLWAIPSTLGLGFTGFIIPMIYLIV